MSGSCINIYREDMQFDDYFGTSHPPWNRRNRFFGYFREAHNVCEPGKVTPMMPPRIFAMLPHLNNSALELCARSNGCVLSFCKHFLRRYLVRLGPTILHCSAPIGMLLVRCITIWVCLSCDNDYLVQTNITVKAFKFRVIHEAVHGRL